MPGADPMSSAPTLDDLRQARQLEFLRQGNALEVGTLHGLPWTAEALAATTAASPHVALTLESGLTAIVHRVESGDGRAWTLKRARPQPGVHNVDGRTSFLNEVQRRIDIEALKAAPDAGDRWDGLVDTRWASLRHGVILSPWIDGLPVAPDAWDERRLGQVLGTLGDLWLEGLFDWDPSPGNLLDDGRHVRLFDFGYCYRFDPRRQFNTAGHGDDQPMFHPVERFETRTFSAALLHLERRSGTDAALAAFRRHKSVAREVVRRMRAAIAARGATGAVTDWLDALVANWSTALGPGGDLATLYLAENWRSHALDLDDDLRGRSCTPTALQRADWLLDALAHHHDALRAAGAFFHGDDALDPAALRERYAARRAQALAWQLPIAEPPSPLPGAACPETLA
jgi:hypothetical protein